MTRTRSGWMMSEGLINYLDRRRFCQMGHKSCPTVMLFSTARPASRCCAWTASAMQSTKPNTERCLSSTALWQPTRGSNSQLQRSLRREEEGLLCWILQKNFTQCNVTAARLRWQCMTQRRCITFSTWLLAIHSTCETLLYTERTTKHCG